MRIVCIRRKLLSYARGKLGQDVKNAYTEKRSNAQLPNSATIFTENIHSVELIDGLYHIQLGGHAVGFSGMTVKTTILCNYLKKRNS